MQDEVNLETGGPSFEEGFLAGWLDALWSGFVAGEAVMVPKEVTKALYRKGWLKPLSKTNSDGDRRNEVTPCGVAVVVAANQYCGITRIPLEK